MSFVKPNLFLPGAAKSGTSSLHNYLNMHPEIFMSEKKEPHYFTNDVKYFSKKETNSYYNLFNDGINVKYRGESSTGYMVFPNATDRIKKDIENPKFIFLLRNPIDRIFSHYNWVDSLIGEKETFRRAVERDMDVEPDMKIKFKFGYRNYFQFGLYSKWISQFYKKFDPKNILIIQSEELKENPLKTLNRCCEFLNVSKFNKLEEILANKTVYYKNSSLYYRIIDFLNFSFFTRNIENILPEVSVNFLKRMKAKTSLFVKNSLISKEQKNISIADRKWLQNLYKSDVKLLKEITSLDFYKWKDFR